MNTVLENHVATRRAASLREYQTLFEGQYPALLPLLRESEVSYLVEQDADKGATRHYVLFFRWHEGYLYSSRHLLLPSGAIESRGEPAALEEVAALVADEVSNWNKWCAAQEWKTERLFWLGFHKLIKWALLAGIVLGVIISADAATWGCLAVLMLTYLIMSVVLVADRRRRFPQGYTPKPAHILHQREIKNAGGRVTFSSSTGQYVQEPA